MKANLIIIAILLTLSLVSCRQRKTNFEDVKLVTKSKILTINRSDVVKPDSIRITDFERILKDPNTTRMAVELFNNTYKLNDDDPLELLCKINTDNILERYFYFRVVTNSYKIADASYSEGLGAFGENYVATKTIEFAKYFDNRQCFSERDLESWAGIIMLEMALDGEYEKSDSIVLAYNKTIVNNCVTCTPKQKETIKKLGANLLEKWHDFLINRGY